MRRENKEIKNGTWQKRKEKREYGVGGEIDSACVHKDTKTHTDRQKDKEIQVREYKNVKVLLKIALVAQVPDRQG